MSAVVDEYATAATDDDVAAGAREIAAQIAAVHGKTAEQLWPDKPALHTTKSPKGEPRKRRNRTTNILDFPRTPESERRAGSVDRGMSKAETDALRAAEAEKKLVKK